MVKPVSENTFRQPPMLLGLDCLLLAQPLTDHVRPAKSQCQQDNQFLQALRLNHMRFSKPEAATLQTAKQGLDFPSLGIRFYRPSGVMRRDDDEVLRPGQRAT